MVDENASTWGGKYWMILEGADVEERAAAEADVGNVGVVLAELAQLVALARDRGIVERGGIRVRPGDRVGARGQDRDPLVVEGRPGLPGNVTCLRGSVMNPGAAVEIAPAGGGGWRQAAGVGADSSVGGEHLGDGREDRVAAGSGPISLRDRVDGRRVGHELEVAGGRVDELGVAKDGTVEFPAKPVVICR